MLIMMTTSSFRVGCKSPMNQVSLFYSLNYLKINTPIIIYLCKVDSVMKVTKPRTNESGNQEK